MPAVACAKAGSEVLPKPAADAVRSPSHRSLAPAKPGGEAMRGYQVEIYWTVREAWIPLGPACQDAVQALRLLANIPVPEARKRVRIGDALETEGPAAGLFTEFDFRRVEFVHYLLASGRLSEGMEGLRVPRNSRESAVHSAEIG